MAINKQILLRFGLHPIEVDCYLNLLALGSATVSDVAKRIEKSRSLAYFHLKHLKDRGFIEESRRKTILRYVPKPASAVMQLIQSWTDDLRDQLPLLEALRFVDQETPTIHVSESTRGFFDIYEEVAALPVGSIFRVFEGSTAMKGELGLVQPKRWERFFTRMIERRIKTKALFTDSSLKIAQSTLSDTNSALFRKRLWDVRMVDERSLPFQNLVCIYGDKVSFLFPDISLIVSLKHQRIAQTLQIMFDGLFTLGKPRKNPFEE